MENFTPASALVGGLLIGASAAIFLLVTGRIAGISGIVGGLIQWNPGDIAWRIAFIAGLLIAPVIYSLAVEVPAVSIQSSAGILMLAGFAVGFGTRLGGGCTSGHGVCGVGRLSPRSLVATSIFMVTGILTVYVMRHLVGA